MGKSPYKPLKWVLIPLGFLLFAFIVIFIFVRISDYISTTGKIEPSTLIPLASPISGTITYSGIEEGRVVKEGEELLRFDSRLERYSLELLRGELITYQEALENLLKTQRLGNSQIEKIHKHSDYSQKLDETLFSSASISEAEFITREYQREQERFDLTRSQITLDGEITALKNNITRTRLRIIQQESYLEDFILSSPMSGKLVLSETIFREPESVNFFSIRAVPGIYVNKGGLLGYIISTESMIAKVTLSERKVKDLRVGNTARISLTAYPKSQIDYLSGTLIGISASAQNGEFIGSIEFDVEDLKTKVSNWDILIGTTVNARIHLGSSTFLEKLERVLAK